MSLPKTTVLGLCMLFLFSCKGKKIEPDNIYKYRNYISYTTSGIVSSSEAIKINLTKSIDQWGSGDELPKDLINIYPKTKGKTVLKNGNTLIFTPDQSLKSDTEYSVTIKLGQLYTDVAEEQKKYTFQFKTIKPSLTVSTNSLQSYDKDWQYVEGVIKSADVISLENAKKLLKVKQGKREINIVWNESFKNSRYFDFRLDSIQRLEKEAEVEVSWNGKVIGSDIKGKESITIPGKNNFQVTNVEIVNGKQQYIAINFSDPLKKNQNFTGLISIQNVKAPKFVVDGNVLKVYHEGQIPGTSDVQVFEGIKNTDNYKLQKAFQRTLVFEELKPQVRLLSSGTILPNSQNLKFNFEAVNLSAVDVRVIKVFQNNVLQFLQRNNLNSNSDIRRVGRRILKKTVRLIEDPSQNTKNWKAYSIDLSRLLKADPGAIYRIELSFDKNYSLYNCDGNTNKNEIEETEEFYDDQDEKEELYWDNKLYRYRNYSYNWKQRENPCYDVYYNYTTVSQNLLASNLGVIAKRGNQKNYFFAVTDILTAQPIQGAIIELYNYQQQKFHQMTTNAEGIAKYDANSEAHFAIVKKSGNTTYVKLTDGNSLSLSKFDVSGAKTQRGLKGFIYGERGVWRPGDSIHLNFVLDDNDNKLPKKHPVKLEVRDPNGKLIHKKVTVENVQQFYSFPFATTTENITGVYQATVSVGGAKFRKSLKVETVKPNRLKMSLDFDKEVFSSLYPLKGKLQVNWLHGAPARNVKAEIDAKLININTTFKGFKDYVFNDPTRNYYTEEVKIFDGNVNENGVANISKGLQAGKNAPGMLRINFLVKAFENGGDFSIDAFSKLYAPYSSFVGLKSPKADDYGSYQTGQKHRFQIASVTDQGKPIQKRKIEVKIYKIEWRWWWNSGRDNLSSYNSDSYHRPYKTFKVFPDERGIASFDINIPKEERGRYLIRVIDPVSGHATGKVMYFYDNWWENSPTDDKEAAKMLIFNTDKKSYQVGETAKITFPSAHVAKALISLENGTEVLGHQWTNTKKGKTVVEIPITKKMMPNFFVNISLLQPHAKIENDLPIRLYGTIPVKVEDPSTRLEPIITIPDSVEPEKEFKVTVSEKSNKPMTYTLAIVEEGLLDLTRFKTPNPYGTFYAREALGVRTWDIYDDVVGAYSGSIDQVFAIGGDGSSSAAKNRKANRFKPVVKYLGPFNLRSGKKTHSIKLPNYIGAVRTMVVAGDIKNEAYGNAEKSVTVKKPLMVLASLPRKLSPGEQVTLPVTVFATEKSIKEVSVQLQLGNGIEVVGKNEALLKFSKTGELMTEFKLDVSKANGIKTIGVIAKSGLKTAKFDVEIDVVNPNPITSRVNNKILQANQDIALDFETFGVTGTNSAVVQISSVPSIDFDGRLAYLIQYPHGCVEQTTSSVFPQLFMTDLFDLSTKKKGDIDHNIKKGIERLGHFQRPNGGMSYWIGEDSANDWGSSYAGHFMLEAEKKGYVLPFAFKSNWVRYQKEAARNWKPSYDDYSDLNQAYRLYTLALSGNPDLGAMNRLREYDRISNDAKWRLAAAYALIGQKQASKQLANTASIEFNGGKYSYSYGSVTRNKSMALETMVLLNDDRRFELAKSIAKDLSSDVWMSTQTTAYSLLAMGKMLTDNGGKSIKIEYQIRDIKKIVTSSKSVVERALKISEGKNKIQLKSLAKNTLYISVITKGKLPLGSEIDVKRGFAAEIKYTLPNGTLVDVKQLKQGQDFMAKVTVKNLKNEWVKDIALTQLFPSGWEIVNTRFTDYGTTVESKARYTDIRDDRVNFYFDLGRKGTGSGVKTFTVLLNASYLGKYYLPGLQVEAMYDNDYLVRSKGQWIQVVK